MAIQRYGEGAVFFSALDSLWRWRYPYGSFDYDRLWTRVVRYLGETRLHGTQKQVKLGTEHRTYAPGEKVHINLKVLDPALMKQLSGQPVFVAIISPKGDKYMVEMRPRADGTPNYDGFYRARTIGSIKVVARQSAPGADSEQKPLFEEKTSFLVRMQSLEHKDTSADLDGLRRLAEETGGKYYDYRTVGDVDRLAGAISTDPLVLEQSRLVEVWDGWLFLGLFVALAATEWSLRKWWGLL